MLGRDEQLPRLELREPLLSSEPCRRTEQGECGADSPQRDGLGADDDHVLDQIRASGSEQHCQLGAE